MSTIAVPPVASLPRARRIPWVVALVIALGVVGVAWAAMLLSGRSSGGAVAGEFFSVQPMDLDITITKDGELQAVSNVEIVSPVEGQNVILEIAPEGSFVHKGDVVCKLESSEIQRKIETAQLDLQKAESDLTAARENKEIQDSTNAANLEAANVELILARLDLQQYVEGTYPSDRQNAQTSVEMSKISVKDKEDNLAQTRSLFSKGFVTSVDVKKAELELLTAQNDLDKQSTALMVLEKYTHEKEVTDRRNKVAQAEKKLVRVQRENASQLAQKVSDLNAKDQTLSLRRDQLKHMQEQLEACTIKAPGDGMVVYSSSSGGGWGRRDTPIQPGATVRMQEQIIRLPDTSAVKAVARISEAQVSRLRVDPTNPIRSTVKIVGQPNPIGGTLTNISIMADSSSRWFSPDTKEYPVDIVLDHTPGGLKPGLSVETKLYVDRLKQVLAVPLGAVYSAGPDSYVFTRGSGDVTATKVTLGQVNETHAQINSGLSRGQQVLILQAGQGRELLEKAGIKVAASTTQPSDVLPPRPPQMPPMNTGGNGSGGGSTAQGGGDRSRGPGGPGGSSSGERRGGRSRDRQGGGAGAGATSAPTSS
jgi:multidrug resistance efflux pump